MVPYTTMFVHLLLSKRNHAAARPFLLMLGAAFDACKMCTSAPVRVRLYCCEKYGMLCYSQGCS